MPRIAVFGATGQTGRLITRLLLEDEGAEVVACSRTSDKLRGLRATFPDSGTSLETKRADVYRATDVESIARDVDVVVGATSRWEHGLALAELAVQSSTAYCGTYLSNPIKWRRLRELESSCRDREVMIVDDAGSHPGLPAAIVRWVARSQALQSAWVGARFDLEWDRLDLARDLSVAFCAESAPFTPDRFVNTFKDSFDIQGDVSGAFHPNSRGHDAYRQRPVETLRERLTL